MRERVEQLTDELDRSAVLALWDESLQVPDWDGAPLWLHGDLHPANVLVHAGRLSAVIDFGDITAGDPATDLSVAWMMFDVSQRPFLRAAAGRRDDDTWARARGRAPRASVAILSGRPTTRRWRAPLGELSTQRSVTHERGRFVPGLATMW
jgi:aminoglycoside phosphotransferase (APT) family kinase protein